MPPVQQPAHAARLTLSVRAVVRGLPILSALALCVLTTLPVQAQTTPPTDVTTPIPAPAAAPKPRETPAPLDGLPIARVEVVGNTRTDARLILDQVRAQQGQSYSRALVDVDVRSVAALDRFVTVRAEVEGIQDDITGKFKAVVVRFIVEERPVVSAVEILGERAFSGQQIRDVIVTRSGLSIDPFTIDTDRKAIISMYNKKGYAQTTVDIDQQLLKDGVVRYTITEGPKALIRSITIEGNSAVKTRYLKFKISTKTYFWIFRKGILDEDKLQADMVTIRDIYKKRGYLDVRVSYSLDYSPDKSKLNVRFAVVEGPQYHIGKITISGNKVFPSWELMSGVAHFGPGSIAESDKIEALKKRIEDAYGHEGYVSRTVAVTTPYTENPGIVDLHFEIVEGEPYVVGRVIIRGNPNIQDRVVRRQIRIYPDQTFDLVLIRKSIERLKATRLFKDARVTDITAPGNPAGVRDALVEVAEGQTGRFSIGAGVSTNSGLVGQISIEQQNFDIANPPRSGGEFFRGQGWKGAGQYFQILLEPGTEFQRYRIRFDEPYLFDSPYSFSNDLFFFTRGRESWNERRIGDTVTFGRRFGDVWAASLGFRAEQVTIGQVSDSNNNQITDADYFLTDPNTHLPVGPFSDSAQEILDAKGSHILTSFKPGISRDTTDSRVFPTTGTRTSLTWEQYGAMGGELTFSKLVFHFDWYKTLYEDLFERKTVFKLSNEIGGIVGGKSVFYERFYGGGIGSLRGFRFRGVSPRSGPLKDPVGGDFSWVTTGEVNFPIYKEVLRGVVFVDIGTVETDINISSIRSDVGFGFRVTLPFFGELPLAVDFALPVTKQADDKTQFFAFSLGAVF